MKLPVLALLLALPGPALGWTLARLPQAGSEATFLRLDSQGSAFLCTEGSGEIELWLARAASAYGPGAALEVTLGAGPRRQRVPASVRREAEGFDGLRAVLPAADEFWPALIAAPALAVTLPGLARWTLSLEGFAQPAAAFVAACRG